MKTMHTRVRTPESGVTLVEIMATVAVLAILAAVGWPMMSDFLHSRRLLGVSQSYGTDFYWARSLAVQNNEHVNLQFGTSAAGSCYMVFTGVSTACKCHVVPACNANGKELRLVLLPAADGVDLVSKSAAVRIEPTRGAVTPTLTVELTGSTGQQIKHVTNIMGRTRVCTPGGAAMGMPAC